MNVFMEVSQLCRDTDAFLVEKAKVSSPLLKVQLFERSQAWTDKLMSLQRNLNSWHEGLISDLKALDAEWHATSNSDRTSTLQRLEQLYRLFSYFNRWSAQIQERIARLSF